MKQQRQSQDSEIASGKLHQMNLLRKNLLDMVMNNSSNKIEGNTMADGQAAITIEDQRVTFLQEVPKPAQ